VLETTEPVPEPSSGPEPTAYYTRVGETEDAAGVRWERFAATPRVGSPWGPGLQHGGPVTALLVRAMAAHGARPDARISRVSVELLGAVPMTEVEVTARLVRPGRRIELLAAEMRAVGPDGEQRTVATASAWRLRTGDTARAAYHSDAAVAPPVAETMAAADLPLPDGWRAGFVSALDWQLVTPFGRFGTPTLAWTRLTGPLVAGERTTDLDRVMAIADIANGIGARLDPRRWSFLNTDLQIHLFEPPAGEWVGIEAETSIGTDGVAMSAAVIHAAHGPIGRIAQNVLVERRA
jgi:acyl-coenzyme A thioesterase PaaI-like protein